MRIIIKLPMVIQSNWLFYSRLYLFLSEKDSQNKGEEKYECSEIRSKLLLQYCRLYWMRFNQQEKCSKLIFSLTQHDVITNRRFSSSFLCTYLFLVPVKNKHNITKLHKLHKSTETLRWRNLKLLMIMCSFLILIKILFFLKFDRKVPIIYFSWSPI